MGSVYSRSNIELSNIYMKYKGQGIKKNKRLLMDGAGILEYNDGSIYRGNFLNDEYHGYGKLVNDYLSIEGIWKKGIPNGKIKLWFDKYYFNGNLLNGYPHGKCKLNDSEYIYIGNFKDGVITGKGLVTDKDNNLLYEGLFRNNIPNGMGKYYLNHLVITSNFINGIYYIDNNKLEVEFKLDNPFNSKININECSQHNFKRLKYECNICFENHKNILFLPCKHLCCCESCAKKVNLCPMCNTKINSKEKIYIT